MKNWKKLLALVLALVLALSLCACSAPQFLSKPLSFEEKLAKSDEQMKQAKSMHTDMDMDLGMSMAMSGQSQTMDMSAHYTTDMQTEPMKVRMIMDISAMGMNQKMIYYAVQEDKALTVYLSLDDGAHWNRQSIASLSDIMPQDLNQQTEMFLACAANFTETGKEEINGSAATVYSGVISGEYVEEAIKASGALDTLSSTMGLDVPEDLFRDLGDIPTTIAIDDESSLLVRYTMDMGTVMQTLMTKIMDLILADTGESAGGLELKIERALITTTLSQLNSVEEIVIPEEAKAA